VVGVPLSSICTPPVAKVCLYNATELQVTGNLLLELFLNT